MSSFCSQNATFWYQYICISAIFNKMPNLAFQHWLAQLHEGVFITSKSNGYLNQIGQMIQFNKFKTKEIVKKYHYTVHYIFDVILEYF
jgi:hypothetical protein